MRNQILAISVVMFFASCQKLIEVDAPITSINTDNVYNSDATAAAVLTGLYANLSNSAFSGGGITQMSIFPSLSADELTLFNSVTDPTYIAYYTNKLSYSNTGVTDFWTNIYPIVFAANSAIEGMSNSDRLSETVKRQLIGEAKFIRAFCFFYLVNLYGDVPLPLTGNYKVNAALSRRPQSEVWNQLIADLLDAKSLLSDSYLGADIQTTTPERVRPTKWAAAAMLARAYLYTGNWEGAKNEAASIINESSLFNLIPLTEVFLKNSNEAIWQLQPVVSGYNTRDATLFILPETGPNDQFPVYLSKNLINSFEPNDQRSRLWIDSVVLSADTFYYSYKYKIFVPNSPVDEYLMVLRLAEQYLIKAEAEAQLNEVANATTDLNFIRQRASLSDFSASNKDDVLAAIARERRVELFTEWGHRWFDLKRTGTIDAVMSIVSGEKGTSWNTARQWYPIPGNELSRNPNLTQNEGY